MHGSTTCMQACIFNVYRSTHSQTDLTKRTHTHARHHLTPIIVVNLTSEPTPHVASSTAQMYVRASKLRDVKEKCMAGFVLQLTL